MTIRLKDISISALIGTILFLLSCIVMVDIVQSDVTFPSLEADNLIVHQKNMLEASISDPLQSSFTEYLRQHEDIVAFQKNDGLSVAYTIRPDKVLPDDWVLPEVPSINPVLFFRKDALLWNELAVDRAEMTSTNHIIAVDERRTMRLSSLEDLKKDERAFDLGFWEGELSLKELEGVEMLYPIDDISVRFGTWIVPKGENSSLVLLKAWFDRNGYETNVWGSSDSFWTFYYRQLSNNAALRLLSILTVEILVMIFFLFTLARVRRLPEERIHYLLGRKLAARFANGFLLIIVQNLLAGLLVSMFAVLFGLLSFLPVWLVATPTIVIVQFVIESSVALIAFWRYRYA